MFFREKYQGVLDSATDRIDHGRIIKDLHNPIISIYFLPKINGVCIYYLYVTCTSMSTQSLFCFLCRLV